MGYSTAFRGQFKVMPPLRSEHAEYLRQFRGTRRMKRDAARSIELPDPARLAVGLPVGEEGGYFVGGGGLMGQAHDASVTDYNLPPSGQHGLWCQWVPTDDGTAIEWDGGEKFHEYVPWLEYLITHFLAPWGYTLNGEVEWRGDDWDDTGTISVIDNEVLEV